VTGLKVAAAVGVLLLAIPDAMFVPHPSRLDHAISITTLSVFGVAGLVASVKRPDSRIGPLMILYAFVAYARDFGSSTHLTLFLLGTWASTMPVAVVAHLVLTYPSGRAASFLERAVIVGLYVNCLLDGVLDAGYEGLYRITAPRAVLIVGAWTAAALIVRLFWNSRRRRPIPLLAVLASSAFLAELIVVYNVLDFVRLGNPAEEGLYRVLTLSRSSLTLLALGLVFFHVVRVTRPTRRGMVPTWISASVLALITVVSWTAVGHPSEAQVGQIQRWIGISAALIPLSFLWGLLRMRLVRGTVGKLVIELGESPAGGLRGALARTLRDPSLELAFWLPESGVYVDSEGRPVELPGESSGRAVTVLARQGEPLAALVHDPALANEREVVEAAGAAARLALENERLHAEARAQLEEVRASRTRIVAAADEARMRVERDLHDGAQQRLVTLSLALRMAQEQLGESPDPTVAATLAEGAAELKLALTELRELARGIHPAILTEEGLGPALHTLAERSPLPAEVRAAPADRVAPAVEASAYFVVAEALANAAKYSGASKVTIEVAHADGRLMVEVADDGIGGADPSGGSGLRGLADRVAALDGRLEVDSPTGRGTRVLAEIPCG
jgi:signal transduction histidine kinase